MKHNIQILIAIRSQITPDPENSLANNRLSQVFKLFGLPKQANINTLANVRLAFHYTF